MSYDLRRRLAAPTRPMQGQVVPLHVAEQIELERRRLAQELEATRREVQQLRETQDRLVQRVRADEEERRALLRRVEAGEQASSGGVQRVGRLEAQVASLREELSRRGPAVVPGPEMGESAVLRLGDVHDSVQRALSTSRDVSSPWHQGYERIGAQVQEALRAAEVRLVGERGEVFDPYQHEAVGTVPAGGQPAGRIAEIVRSGLRSEAGLLRPAQVIVAQ
jgi:molecular chaperone GrpE (heat shock protein)